MSSETTKKQIKHVDQLIGDASASIDWHSYTQAKLALVQALEIQERMERGELERLRRLETEMSVLLAEADNGRLDGNAMPEVLDIIKRHLVGGRYERKDGSAWWYRQRWDYSTRPTV